MGYKVIQQSNLKSYEDEQGNFYLEGWANYNLPDRVGERMNPFCNLEKWKKVPAFLFNHDQSFPLGQGIEAIPKEEGLWVKLKWTNSQALPMANYLRDLTKEGATKALSIRYEDEVWVRDPKYPGVKFAQEWSLMEVSLVTMPCQPESVASATFDVTSGKALAEAIGKCKSVNQARAEIMKVKGAQVAKLISEKLSDMEKVDKFDKETLMNQICQKGGCNREELSRIMSGDVTPVTDNALAAIASELSIPKEELTQANAADIEKQKGSESSTKSADDAGATTPPTTESDPLESQMQECVRSKIPALIAEGKTPEEAVAAAMGMCSDEKGCDPDKYKASMGDHLKMAVEEEEKKKATESAAPAAGSVTAPVKLEEPPSGNQMLEYLKQSVMVMSAVLQELKEIKDWLAQNMVSKSMDAPKDPLPQTQEGGQKSVPAVESKTTAILEKRVRELEAQVAEELGLP
jgi:HK97 family phage prohead protease